MKKEKDTEKWGNRWIQSNDRLYRRIDRWISHCCGRNRSLVIVVDPQIAHWRGSQSNQMNRRRIMRIGNCDEEARELKIQKPVCLYRFRKWRKAPRKPRSGREWKSLNKNRGYSESGSRPQLESLVQKHTIISFVEMQNRPSSHFLAPVNSPSTEVRSPPFKMI
jgi:hypothetical protein